MLGDNDITECDCIICKKNSKDRIEVEGYLAHKWGVTHLLPDNHPYRYKPPKMTRYEYLTLGYSDFECSAFRRKYATDGRHK